MLVYQRVIIMFRIKIATTGVDPEPPIFINRTQSSKTHLLMAFGIIRFARKDRESCGMKRPQKCLPSGQQKHTKTHGIPWLWMASHKNHEESLSVGSSSKVWTKNTSVEKSSAPRMAIPLLAVAAVDFPLRLWWPWWRLQRPSWMLCFWGVDRVGFNPMSQSRVKLGIVSPQTGGVNGKKWGKRKPPTRNTQYHHWSHTHYMILYVHYVLMMFLG